MKRTTISAPGLAAVSVALSLAACVEPALDTGTTAQEILYDPDSDGCPKWGCGTNSPVMGAYGFHELDEAGTPNGAGLRLLSLQKGSQTFRADVVRDRLVARPWNDPTTVALQGTQLQGARLVIATPTVPYYIYIQKVSQTTPFWIGGGVVETYDLTYSTSGYSPTLPRVCANPPNGYGTDGDPGWPAPLEAILFTGDRYSADDLTVTASTPASAGTWFNIGCAGSVLAKLHLNRHTSASATSTYSTSWAQRQALLKMYASDLCGDGKPYTHAGVPLHWQNVTHWRDLTGAEQSYEALWGPSGALCLDEHRLKAQENLDIAPACMKPTCASLAGFPATWPSTAYLLSANP